MRFDQVGGPDNMKSKSWNRCGELVLMNRIVQQSSAPGCPVGGMRRPKMQNNSKVERKFDLIRELKGSVHGRLRGWINRTVWVRI